MSILINTKVKDVMIFYDYVPKVTRETILKEALEEMGRTRLGIVCVIDQSKKLLGIITDGDIRRKLLNVQKPFSAFFVDDVLDHSIKSPYIIKPEDALMRALDVMEERQIWDLPVVDNGTLIGLLHLHRVVKILMENKG
jgi:CBS domain-containing protein